MWVYSPGLEEPIFPASTYLRFGTEKDQRLTELAILSTARELAGWSAPRSPCGGGGVSGVFYSTVMSP